MTVGRRRVGWKFAVVWIGLIVVGFAGMCGKLIYDERGCAAERRPGPPPPPLTGGDPTKGLPLAPEVDDGELLMIEAGRFAARRFDGDGATAVRFKLRVTGGPHPRAAVWPARDFDAFARGGGAPPSSSSFSFSGGDPWELSAAGPTPRETWVLVFWDVSERSYVQVSRTR